MKSPFTIVSVLFWLAYLGGAIASKGLIESAAQARQMNPAVIWISLFFFMLAGIFVNTLVAENISGEDMEPGAGLNPEERARLAEKQAQKHLDEGNHRLAVVAYENAGLTSKAIAVAEKHRDFRTLGRLFAKMGKHDQARKHYLRAGDSLAVANLSMLLGDFSAAREQYGNHLDDHGHAMQSLEKAEFMDRAGLLTEASALYEANGIFDRAAESAEAAGDGARSATLRERAQIIHAYEKGKEEVKGALRSGSGRHLGDSHVFLEQGDFFAAAWALRKAGEHAKAAATWERIEEYIRAANDLDKCGEQEKAAELRQRANVAPIPPAPASAPTQTSVAPPPPTPQAGAASAPGNPVPPPAPGVAPGPQQAAAMAPPSHFPNPARLGPPSHTFQPLTSTSQLIPLFIPSSYRASMEIPTNAKAAAAYAGELAIQGKLVQAADVHFQAGQTLEALQCLKDAGRRREAALMALGAGEYGQAAELMADVLSDEPDAELGLLLGQMLVRLGDADLAVKLLRSRLARQITPETAPLVASFARMLEKEGALSTAVRLLEELEQSGLAGPEISARLKKLRARAEQEGDHPERLPEGAPDASSILTSGFHRKMGAWDFLQAALADSDDQIPIAPPRSHPHPEESPTSAPTSNPASSPANGEEALEETQPDAPPDPAHQVSLLGSSEETVDLRTKTKGQKNDQDPFEMARRYVMIQELGRGGMGVVYEARDQLLERPVALKLLNSFGASQEEIRQFLLEARAIARLRHPHVIGVYDMGVMDLRHYIAMEFVRGLDLRQYIAREKQLPLREALRLFVEIAEGLQAAHEAGIVHRDIKPANVLLDTNLGSRIVDFGLAKLPRVDEAPESPEEQHTIFRFAGTPGFMAPEQIRGESAAPAADIYALGIMLFNMLTGIPPHRAHKIEGAQKIAHWQLSGQLPRLRDHRPDAPPAIEQLYQFCTALNVGERFQEISVFLDTARQWRDAV